MAANIPLHCFIICCSRIVNPFPGVQTHIFLVRSRNLANIDSCKARLVVAATCNKHIISTGRDIHPARRINTQRAHIVNHKCINYTVGFNFIACFVIGSPDLFFHYVAIRLYFLFHCGRQRITVGIPHGHIRCVCTGQQFQRINRFRRAVAQIAGFDYRRRIRVHSNAPGFQRYILTLNVGYLVLGLGTYAALLVHNGIADGIEKLILCPGKLHLFRIIRILQRLVFLICGKIIGNISIGCTVFLCKHVFDLLVGFSAGKQLILLFDPGFIISRILLQPPDIGAFIVRGTCNQSGIDPVVDQIILVHIITIVCQRQRVKQPSARCAQSYIAVLRYDNTHTHAAFGFFNINVVLGCCIKTRRIFSISKRFGRGIDQQGLPVRADCTVCTC